MKKIGLFTINDYNNYGNRLQNYASQSYLESLGFLVDTVVNTTEYSINAKKPSLSSRISNLRKMPIEMAASKISGKVNNKINRNKIREIKEARLKKFEKFTEEYIKETDYSVSDVLLPKGISNKYDFFVTGSDQVWNPDNPRTSSIDFLTFAESYKRIALAPSFGVSSINRNQSDIIKEWLNDFTHLSSREDEGARIIKTLTGRDVPVLVDPTLLIDKEKWLSISQEDMNKPSKKYLLTYFLGGVPKKHQKQIKTLCKKYNLEIVNLGDIREEKTYNAGPSEFIDYINSCSFFCTDSFHGAVFSILLEKPFLVYKREGISASMYSRINTLLDKFSLHHRKAENIMEIDSNIFDIDYTHVSQILEQEKSKVHAFLSNALEINDKE